jgi:hypothetical protein
MSACILALVVRHVSHIFSAPFYFVICDFSFCSIFSHIFS